MPLPQDLIPFASPLTVEEETALRAEVNKQLPKIEIFKVMGDAREADRWIAFAKLLNMLDKLRRQIAERGL